MRTNRYPSLIAAFAIAIAGQAQAPQGMNYQAVARDVDGDAVVAQPIGVQFTLHQGTALGAVVFAETHSTSTNAHGLFSLTVGGGTPGAGTFSAIDWSNGPYFLEVGLDLGSMGSYVSVGTQQLMSVPYALYAGRSNVPDGTEVGQILHWTGAAWAADSGLYVAGKRFGIGGETTPEAPLGIKGEPGQDDKMICFTNIDATQKWNINLNPTGSDVDGFSIDDATTGIGSSRLFIAPVTGNVGLGTTDPDAALTIRSDNPLKQHFQNGDVPTQGDFWDLIDSRGMSTGQGNPDSAHIHLTLQSTTGHLGIGTDDPPAPLAIKSRDVLKTYFETGDIPVQDNFGFTSDGTGFGIKQGAPGSLVSRLFIRSSSGYVGLGTVEPEEKLHIESSTSSGITGLKILNTATTNSQGWRLGHVQDPIAERDGAFSLTGGDTELLERITVLSTGNVGINELIPDVKLHVSRPLSDPSAALDLIEGTGIAVLGPITDNIVFDYRGIQARTGAYGGGGGALSLAASTLNLQRLGGDILIHGDASIAEADRITITSDGKIGIGRTATEKVEINGAITIGDTQTASPADGTIRFNGTDFEGRVAGDWVVFNGSAWGKVDNSDVVYALGAHPKVGIGITTPNAMLHVRGQETCNEGSASASFENSSSTTSTSATHDRVGLGISCTGTWSANPEAKNIGLYVSTVSGQSEASSNLAAVLNGNVVVGDISGQSVGTGGTNVLAIQNGAAPAASSGTPVSGIQIYSADLGVGSSSVFNVMTGDGSVIKLYRQAALAVADGSPVGPVYDPTTAAVIENMRSRLNDLESRLIALGLLVP